MPTIDEIREALAMATPGPWDWSDNVGVMYGQAGRVIFETGSEESMDPSARDARLIESAPAWLTWLCSEVERLQLKHRCVNCCHWTADCGAHLCSYAGPGCMRTQGEDVYTEPNFGCVLWEAKE